MGSRSKRSRASAGAIADRQAVFREVNDRIRELSDAFSVTDEPLVIVCECGDGACCELVTLTAAEYRELRRNPALFAVAPGHEIPSVERVVARNDRFATVEKHA